MKRATTDYQEQTDMTNNYLDLTEYARAGYDGNDNPYLYSSPCWYAHSLGQYLHASGRTPPRNVRMSRGSSVRANDMLFRHTRETGWERVN
jgi:hypothetical protein